jgi:hypothetical protein
MKKVNRKKSLREASYVGKGGSAPEEIPLSAIGTVPPTSRKPSATAAAAASAIRGTKLTAKDVARELEISDMKALGLISVLMKEKKGIKPEQAAEEIISAHREKSNKASSAEALYQRFVSAPDAEDRPSHPEFAQVEIKQYANPDELEDKFTREGFPKLAFYAATELRSFLADQEKFHQLVDEVNNLIKQRDELKAQGKRLPTGKYRFFDKEIEDKFQSLEAPILNKQEVLSAFVKSTIKPKIKKFEDLKNGDQTAISNFLDDLKKSTQKQGVGLKVNVMFELEDKGKISKEEIKEIVDLLKSKKLLENKTYIKLANILF